MTLRGSTALLLCWLLSGQSAIAACTAQEHLSIDIAHVGDTSIALTGYSTANSNQTILVIPINWQSGPAYATVSSVSLGGLSWSRRGVPHQMASSTCHGIGAPCFVDVEVWQARSTAPLVSQNLTVNWTAGVLIGEVLVAAFDGAILPYFDTNSSLPAFNSNPGGASSFPGVGGVSTTSTASMLLALCEWNTIPGGNFCVPPAGWNQISAPITNQPFNGRFMGMNLSDLVVSSPQSGITVTSAGLSTPSWMMVVDALNCGAPPPPPVPHPFVWINE